MMSFLKCCLYLNTKGLTALSAANAPFFILIMHWPFVVHPSGKRLTMGSSPFSAYTCLFAMISLVIARASLVPPLTVKTDYADTAMMPIPGKSLTAESAMKLGNSVNRRSMMSSQH